ncbi:unnamed protein product [Moneuplotes crassus]|uniref:Uncharacterized protein n=1 Tax=Euplotes crassus TaxID=5936 RepID=A0AAD1XNS0_EUPCR|nr:unnamed protein product [Moneuplotes crassus]
MTTLMIAMILNLNTIHISNQYCRNTNKYKKWVMNKHSNSFEAYFPQSASFEATNEDDLLNQTMNTCFPKNGGIPSYLRRPQQLKVITKAKEYIASISKSNTHPSVEQFNETLSKIYKNRSISSKCSRRRKSHQSVQKSTNFNTKRKTKTSNSKLRKPKVKVKEKSYQKEDRNQEALYNYCYKKIFGTNQLKIVGKYTVTSDDYQKRVPRTAAISRPAHLIQRKQGSSYFENRNHIRLREQTKARNIISKIEQKGEISKTFYNPKERTDIPNL